MEGEKKLRSVIGLMKGPEAYYDRKESDLPTDTKSLPQSLGRRDCMMWSVHLCARNCGPVRSNERHCANDGSLRCLGCLRKPNGSRTAVNMKSLTTEWRLHSRDACCRLSSRCETVYPQR